MKGNSIAGRKRNDGIDYYQTPTWAVEKLLEIEKFEGNILEPCSGAGAISKVLENNGYTVTSSDIREDNNVYGNKGINVFDIDENINNIITNPPYFCAKEVIEKCLSISNKKVVMLLKLAFLESVNRYEFFKNSPLKIVYVFSKRVNPVPEGMDLKTSGTIAYAWFVWEHGYTGKPQIEWIL